ncbi:MAG TPA: polysaccharide biosynthesis/export family protein [Terriglobales bacterium]|nr:polysaccharide biosynthesis/export family protein [Terriglobales bacterium]
MTRTQLLTRLFPLALLLALPLWGQAALPSAQAPAHPPAVAASRAAAPATTKGDPEPAAEGDYKIGPGDVLAIDVFHEPEISQTLPVRPDGWLSLPLTGEIHAQGLTTLQLAAAIATRLQKYIDHPAVTVMLKQAESQRYNILGMVTKPGSYPLDHPLTILDAIALAGGLRDFANSTHIYLIRKRASDGVEMRYPFNYDWVSRGLHLVENVRLRANDTIVVP